MTHDRHPADLTSTERRAELAELFAAARLVAALPRLTTARLRREYAAVFGEPTTSGNKG